MSFEFRLDISRCIGCRACEVACVTANDLVPERSRNWVKHLEADDSPRAHSTFAPYLCHHCSDAPCVAACPTGASYSEDGRVLVDAELCIGCGLCVPACPYEARFVEPETNVIEKCTLCEGRTEEGLAPACFDVCPAGARIFVEDKTVDGQDIHIEVGDINTLDPGREEMHLVTDAVNPHPQLRFSGLPDDLALLAAQRPPREAGSLTGELWRNGAGYVIQGLGAASALAMGAMVGLHMLRDRKEKVAAAEAPKPKADAAEPPAPKSDPPPSTEA